MKKITIAILAGASLFALASCSDLLDIKQHGVVSLEDYYKTDDDILSANASLYSDLRGQYVSGIQLKCGLDDDFGAGGGGRGDNSGVEKIDEYTFDAESGGSGYFSGMYTMIHDGLVICENIDPSFSPAAARAVAEAKFVIGYAYFELITLWGTPPLVDHVLKDASEYKQPNGKPEELWAYAEKNLTEAIASGALSEKSSVNDRTTWRITKQAAQTILGKVYLWQGKNKEAADVLDEVINSNKYALFDQYGEMLDVQNKHNCESILEYDYPIDPNNVQTNFVNGMAMWRMSKIELDPEWTAYYAADGYGFWPPTKSLYDEFVSVEGKDGYRLNESIRTYEQLHEQIGMVVVEPVLCEGLFMWKSRLKADQIVGNAPWNTVRNLIHIRLGEVYLLAAEANLSVNPTKATQYFNVIRTRAKAPTVANVTLADIQTEKRLELCWEGSRFQDLNRWGIAYEKLKDCNNVQPYLLQDGTIEYRSLNNPVYGFKKGKHELLPFPANEIRLNENIVQNPGW